MFTSYEMLGCQNCGASFSGRRPATGGATLCRVCLKAYEESVINEDHAIPDSVLNEITNNRGAEDE